MRAVLMVAEIREREAAVAARVGEAELIRRASHAVARRALRLLGGGYGRRVVVLAGKGHNGADALWAGVALVERGARVHVALPSGDPADGHGREPLDRLRRAGAGVGTTLPRADLVVDGMLGIGATGELRGAAADLAAAVAAAGVPVLAVDLPSGVAADTGAAGAAVRADVTVTFGALKPGLVTGRGAELAGVVEVADIGLAPGPTWPPALAVLDADDVAALLPHPVGETDKYARGVVGLVAGSPAYAGAAVLAAGGALRAGAGMVRLHAEPAVVEAVRRRWPEVVAAADGVADGRVDAWVVGPGLGTDHAARERVRAALSDGRPVLLDADALTLVAAEPELLRRRMAPTVLTPHPGEFARLTGRDRAATAADRIGAARAAARDLGAVVLLKGLATVVAGPDGTARINPTGTPALATAGTGDVLAGAVGAYLAAGLEPLAAAAAGAWLHGLAGRLAAGDPPAPIVAGDVSARWAEAVRVACVA